MIDTLPPIRSALFLPASNPRAIERARSLPCDMVILDLEDAVKPEDKERARNAAVEAVATGFGDRQVAIRINGTDSDWFDADLAAMRTAKIGLVVLPKAESANQIAHCTLSDTGLLAMIETPGAVLAAAEIARAPGVRGLIAGTNDLAAALRLPDGADRGGLAMALQSIVLAARAAGVLAIDGVWNRLEDQEGLARQCGEGRAFGFDGKSLIHPSQIDATNRAFGVTDAELEDARALIAAATGGAERFRGRMIEAMHVDAAHRLVDLAEARR